MDKASRVLTLFIRLLNGDIIKKSDFSDISNVGNKSIQRDIKDLNTFFYESDYWKNDNTKVVYSRSLSGYRLLNKSYSNHSLAILSLLIKIKSLTPIMHKSVYDLFLKNINDSRIEDTYVLKNVLNHFNLRNDPLPGENLMKLQESINRHLKARIKIDEKFVIKPLSLMYMHYDYWLTYEHNKKLYTRKVRNIESVNILESHPYTNSSSSQSVEFEIDKSIWAQFKQQFSIEKILKYEGDKVIALVLCTELDSYYIAYQLAPLARMIGPKSYIESFINRLEKIKSTYI
ncbi:hypothetical protein K4T47_10155 [Staphylococcus epidermidis]|nr:hypothetical protein [Staphylococcus epidermidis]